MHTPKVLVVEDEFMIAMALEAELQSNGFAVVGPAWNVATALRLIASERPDAAVLDVNLSGEWVTPVAEALREMDVPFILASGYANADLAHEPLLGDAVNVGKPTRPDLLTKRLNDITRRKL